MVPSSVAIVLVIDILYLLEIVPHELIIIKNKSGKKKFKNTDFKTLLKSS